MGKGRQANANLKLGFVGGWTGPTSHLLETPLPLGGSGVLGKVRLAKTNLKLRFVGVWRRPTSHLLEVPAATERAPDKSESEVKIRGGVEAAHTPSFGRARGKKGSDRQTLTLRLVEGALHI